MKLNFMKHRVPAYMGGLLLSLGAMIVIMQAKKAFAPKFHVVMEKRDPAKITPGGSIRIVYGEEPGFFLPPGFPTLLVISKKQSEGPPRPVMRLTYRNLVDRESVAGPLPEVGEYFLNGEFYICASPGVADCTKLVLSQYIDVRDENSANESRVPIDLRVLSSMGLEAGKQELAPK